MYLLKKLFFVLIPLSLIPALALAKTYDGIEFPSSVELDKQKLTLQGAALEAATIFEIDIFVAALYSQKKLTQKELYSPKTTAEINARFVQDADSATVQKYFLQAFDSACKKQCAKLKPELAKHLGQLPAIAEGDQFRFQFYQEKVLLFHNQKLLGSFNGKDWRETFVSFFVGSTAPSQSFSNAILSI